MEQHSPIRIGTRDSKLALWQAHKVQDALQELGWSTVIVPTKSEGDIDLVTPLYAMGVEGVFTKTLDAYLLSNKVDIAVHSMKDVPIQLPQGIEQGAVLTRGNVADILVPHPNQSINLIALENLEATIATGSIRRRAQWLHQFPHHHLAAIRGNLQTRLSKLKESSWDGAVFAAAGLERLKIVPEGAVELPFMLPAPAQGAVMVVARTEDIRLKEILNSINDPATALAVKIERDFLATLMGGCATPIAAHASIKENAVYFTGNITAVDGRKQFEIKKESKIEEANNMGVLAAQELFNQHTEAIKLIMEEAALKNKA